MRMRIVLLRQRLSILPSNKEDQALSSTTPATSSNPRERSLIMLTRQDVLKMKTNQSLMIYDYCLHFPRSLPCKITIQFPLKWYKSHSWNLSECDIEDARAGAGESLLVGKFFWRSVSFSRLLGGKSSANTIMWSRRRTRIMRLITKVSSDVTFRSLRWLKTIKYKSLKVSKLCKFISSNT